MSTVKAWVYTESEAQGVKVYDVWAPDDLADQLSDSNNEGWVSLALVNHDEYICLHAKDIVFFRRDMTPAEKQLRHTIEKGDDLLSERHDRRRETAKTQ